MQVFLLVFFVIAVFVLKQFAFDRKRKQRRDYYRNVYLKSDEWQRKRYVVLKRDNWRCVYCGGRATQVHHKKYAKYNIGKEPIKWLVSICKSCHDAQHR
ncbi:MAG: HNH endonuclease [Bacteroidetes bacterium]|nr:HNH endonuclease [Bacteroidota bacterium]